MAFDIVRNAAGTITRVDAWGNNYEVIPADLHCAWLLKRRTIFPYCLNCWTTTGRAQTVETHNVHVEHGLWELMYTVCSTCLHGALRLTNIASGEVVHLASATTNPLNTVVRSGAREMQTTIHRGFVWWKFSPAGFATMFYYSQFGDELYGILGRRDPLGVPSIATRSLGMLLNGAMVKALGMVEGRLNKLTALLRYYAGGEVVAGVGVSGNVYIGLPKAVVKACKEHFGTFSFSEAMEKFVGAFKFANTQNGREFWINAMNGLFSGEVNPELNATIDTLMDAGILQGPFARSTAKIDAEVNNVLASLGKDKGLNLEMIHRLYGRI